MKYALAIYGAPSNSQSAQTALHFAQELLAAGHSIYRVFFYQDGVHAASTISCPPQDELNLPEAWRGFITEHNIDAVVCIAAALRRGIVNEAEADRYDLPANNLAPGYDLSGLGQLLEATLDADRVVSFGA